jgi:hypothetical protein
LVKRRRNRRSLAFDDLIWLHLWHIVHQYRQSPWSGKLVAGAVLQAGSREFTA